MSRLPVASFVDSFFRRTLFQGDDEEAISTLSRELSGDAEININGNSLTTSEFIDLITTGFRASFTASVVEIRDLNIVSTNEAGTTRVVGQYTIYDTKGKVDKAVLRQSATTIVRVEHRGGKTQITGLWEAQTTDQD
ncbi:uncharacterized protein I303_106916 [Kwoniella dejecticola CBS 10117]|uniref:SnoaL-like domain-containing protein n=1 Tax=Kwoniella dejecticola CBS 10117 TaxID=1296121 RepID=A0A1A5ZTB9_9TREE|nr:uncharacterized protein I303_08445 [Kwoniella dejecticola CBS 10117]OBR81063.1 hypothetical protein I303_08445 [Kwoniella dejecticola CBS 10117]